MMKTKETSTCRKCDGNGKPSKAIMNFHNIQTQDLNKEFETKLLDCIKCESCGHSWIPGTETSSTRKQAIAWWKQLKSNVQLNYWRNYQKTTFTPSHSSNELTGREIEEIYDKEVLEPKRQEEWQESQVNRRYSKPNQKQYTQEEVDKLLDQQAARTAAQIIESNQKQFKQFSPELFKSYINKFSDEDKEKCFEILMRNLDIQKAELINDGINLNLVFVRF